MSYKKLKVKYDKMAAKENQVPNEMVMPYELDDVFQEMLQQQREQVIKQLANESKRLTYIKVEQDSDAETKLSENLKTATSYEPLNLVKSVHIESPAQQIDKHAAGASSAQTISKPNEIKQEATLNIESAADKGNKRPAIDVLEQPILKKRKVIGEEIQTKQKLIRVLPILSTIQNINSAHVLYGLPKNLTTTAGTTTIRSNESLTDTQCGKLKQTKKKSNASLSETIQKVIETNTIIKDGKEMVVLGTNSTTIERINLERIDWQKSSSAVTRNILKHIFGLQILATHNLSGKKSPAFCDMEMPEKGQLDPLIIADVVNFMDLTLNMTEKEVKMAVTSTCADAGKKRKRSITLEEKPEE